MGNKNKVCVKKNGNKFWYKNGLLHRKNGPAVIYKHGNKYWFKNGKCHRTDGPAIEFSNGSKFWCIEGVHFIARLVVDNDR